MKIYPIVITGENSVYSEAADARRAISSGVDGIYLSSRNKNIDQSVMVETYNHIRNDLGDIYIGLHITNPSPVAAVKSIARLLGRQDGLLTLPSAIWVDDMRGDSLDKMSAIEYRNNKDKLYNLRLIGGIAYKNTNSFTEDPNLAIYETSWLADSVDAIITSGKTISHQPSLDKITAMKTVSGDKPIVVVGGVNFDNIKLYRELIDEIIVLNGVETNPGSGKLDHDKLSDLVKVAHDL